MRTYRALIPSFPNRHQGGTASLQVASFGVFTGQSRVLLCFLVTGGRGGGGV